MDARDRFNLIGTTISGKYRVDRVLGEGGCGIVYAGFHVLVGAPVAIKCLKPVGGDRAVEEKITEAFLREAKLLFALTHPGIVRLYDVGALEHASYPVPWVVLEHIDGPTLDAELQRRAAEQRHFSSQELLQIFDAVLDAVAFAHENGVAHRDLKPSNVMLPRTNTGALQPKVLDFGIARRMGEQRHTIGVTAFTPRYAAPEQWDANLGNSGPSTDVFALGLMLAEACTLRPALPGESAASLVAAVMDPNRRIVVVQNRPDLPREIDFVVERATRVRAQDRFADAREMQIALRTALGASAASVIATRPISNQAKSWESIPATPSPAPPVVAAASFPPTPQTPLGTIPTHVVPTNPPAPKSNNALFALIGALFAALVVLAAVLVVTLTRNNETSASTSSTKTSSASTKKAHTASPKSDDGDDDDDEAPPSKKKHSKKSGTVKLTEVVGPEWYTQSQIYDVVTNQSDPLLECYHEALKSDSKLAGDITAIVDVEPDGKTDAPTGASGFGDETFHACVAARITDWKFPKPYPKEEASFILKLVFQQ